jgi:hypothetical protein
LGKDSKTLSSLTRFRWPNLKEIAAQAKQARRVVSCPGDLERPVSPTLYRALQDTEYFISQSCSSLTSHVRRKHWLKLRSAISEHNLSAIASSSFCGPPILLALTRAFFPSFLLSNLPALYEMAPFNVPLNFHDPPLILQLLNALIQSPDSGRSIQPLLPATTNQQFNIQAQPQTRYFQQFVTSVQRKTSTQSSISRFARMFAPSQASLITIPVGRSMATAMSIESTEGQPILRRKRMARLAKRRDPLTSMGWLNVSPRALAVENEELGASLMESRLDVSTPDSERPSSRVLK